MRRICIDIGLLLIVSMCYLGVQSVVPSSRNGPRSNAGRSNATRQRQQSFMAITTTTTTTTPAPATESKRSEKCLIMHLAQHSNLTILFRQIGESGPKHNKTIQIQLELGTERYLATGSSRSKAEAQASSDAYARTRYPKSNLNENTCVIQAKSPINELEELRRNNGFSLSYQTNVDMGPPRTYVIECHINELDLSTHFNSTSKKTAKVEASRLMLAELQAKNVLLDPARRYNESKNHAMHPVARLYEILAARHEPEPTFHLLHQIPVVRGNGTQINFVVQVSTHKHSSVGNGETYKAAKKEAARNMLNEMNFVQLDQ